MRKYRTLNNNQIYTYKTLAGQRVSVYQGDTYLELRPQSDGLFKVMDNGFFTLQPWCYKWETDFIGDRIVVDILGGSCFRIYGQRIHEIAFPQIFPAQMPRWDRAISKSGKWAIPNLDPNRIVELYRLPEFTAVVLYQGTNPLLPDYEACQAMFGKQLNQLGGPIRCRIGNMPLDKVSYALTKNASDFYAYRTETDDYIIMRHTDEPRVFRTLKVASDDAPAVNGGGSNAAVLEAMKAVLSAVTDMAEQNKQLKATIAEMSDSFTRQGNELNEKIAELEKDRVKMNNIKKMLFE